jgi:DNA-3-methyladenine glycosylase II
MPAQATQSCRARGVGPELALQDIPDMWKISEALEHLRAQKHTRGGAEILKMMAQHGPPSFYQAPKDTMLAHFQSLARAIVYQQLAGAAASTIWRRVVAAVAAHPDPPPASLFAKGVQLDAAAAELEDGLAMMEPARVAAVSDQVLRQCGLSGQKLSYIRDLTQHFQTGELRDLHAREDADVRAALLAVKGVGPWTVDMFLMFSLARPDVLPTGDLGVQKGFQALFGLSVRPTPSAMQDLAAPFAPFRSCLAWYSWRAADAPGSTAKAKVRATAATANGLVSTAKAKEPRSKNAGPASGRKVEDSVRASKVRRIL